MGTAPPCPVGCGARRNVLELPLHLCEYHRVPEADALLSAACLALGGQVVFGGPPEARPALMGVQLPDTGLF